MRQRHSLWEILLTSFKLGLTSFGGPVAHLGYFKNEYVDKRKWLDDRTYADIIALCQFLPGPASSQVGISIGVLRGGITGGILSWIGFTMPSVVVLVLFAMLYQSMAFEEPAWILSLKVVAVAVVAHAVLGLGKKLTPDRPRIAIALAAALVMLLFPSVWVQIGVIVASGVVGWLFYAHKVDTKVAPFPVAMSKKLGVTALSILGLLLVGLPVLARMTGNAFVALFDTFFRVGSLVFGGGHVVLPLLEQEVVPTGLLTGSEFLSGYGMAQAVPGPLFTFAGYLGTMMNGVAGAVVATVAIFLPSFLLIIGALPFLEALRKRRSFQGMLTGVNAGVVGILLAAFYDPVFTSAITDGTDFALAAVLFAMLYVWKLPAWAVVIAGVVLGSGLATVFG